MVEESRGGDRRQGEATSLKVELLEVNRSEFETLKTKNLKEVADPRMEKANLSGWQWKGARRSWCKAIN